MTALDRRPIGVFDSGIGGLTVVRALMDRLPFEDLIYFGDSARVPYGVKSVATIEHFTQQIAEFLLKRQVKALIIACNTMAAVAADVVRRWAVAGHGLVYKSQLDLAPDLAAGRFLDPVVHYHFSPFGHPPHPPGAGATWAGAGAGAGAPGPRPTKPPPAPAGS